MNFHALLAAVQAVIPGTAMHKSLEAFGGLTLAYQSVLNGGPAATRLADRVAGFVLRSPLRPVVLYFAPNIVKFLDGLTVALTSLLGTFKDELEKDINEAANPDAKQGPDNGKAS